VSVSGFEERESSNFVGGHYFKGSDDLFEFTVCLSDEVDHEDLPYWVQVSERLPMADGFTDVVDRFVKEKLVPAGFRSARMNNLGKLDEERTDYQ